MKFPIPFAFLLLSCCLSAARAQNESPAQENSANQAVQLKAIKTPVAPYPEEARKNGIEGKVTLSIIVDERGKVSEAKVLSGPTELHSAALESVRTWQYEPPATGPVAKSVEISYGFRKECPGPISDAGEVGSGGWLTSEKGTVVGQDFDTDQPLPRYFEEDRKAGIAGVMVLSIAVMPDGRVKNVHVVKSLSPRLDKAAIESVRRWRFKLIKGSPDALPDYFELKIIYSALCNPRF